MESKQIGAEGEDFAAEYLLGKRWEIVERNFYSNHKELDIIALDGKVLVFVEVKNYSFRSYYPPAYSITKHKKRCIISAAKYYLYKNNIKDMNCRFDVITVYRNREGERTLHHYKNAFDVN